jgi:hypothetical protein
MSVCARMFHAGLMARDQFGVFARHATVDLCHLGEAILIRNRICQNEPGGQVLKLREVVEIEKTTFFQLRLLGLADSVKFS